VVALDRGNDNRHCHLAGRVLPVPFTGSASGYTLTA